MQTRGINKEANKLDLRLERKILQLTNILKQFCAFEIFAFSVAKRKVVHM